jgi:hypothetical protein
VHTIGSFWPNVRNRPADSIFHRVDETVTLFDMFKSGESGNDGGCVFRAIVTGDFAVIVTDVSRLS